MSCSFAACAHKAAVVVLEGTPQLSAWLFRVAEQHKQQQQRKEQQQEQHQQREHAQMEELMRVPHGEELEERLLTKAEKAQRATKRLLEAAEANNTERALAMLKEGADPTVEDAAQWSALQWAVVHGNICLVRELLRSGAAATQLQLEQQQQQQPLHALPWQLLPGLQRILQQEQQQKERAQEAEGRTQSEPPEGQVSAAARAAAAAAAAAAKKPTSAPVEQGQLTAPEEQQQQAFHTEEAPAADATGTAAANNDSHEDTPADPLPVRPVIRKYSPLHWAAFKGHIRILHLLLKAGLSPGVTDALGNTILHQAAAGGCLEAVKAAVGVGVAVEARNARGHTAAELAADEECRVLLEAAAAAKRCPVTGVAFSYKCSRYLCSFTLKFYSKEAVRMFWAYESPVAADCEKLVTWSEAAQRAALSAEQRLLTAFEHGSLVALLQAARETEECPLDCRLAALLAREKKRLDLEAQIERALRLAHLQQQQQQELQQQQQQQEHQPDGPGSTPHTGGEGARQRPADGDLSEQQQQQLLQQREHQQQSGGSEEEADEPEEKEAACDWQQKQQQQLLLLQEQQREEEAQLEELFALVVEGEAASCRESLLGQLKSCCRLLLAQGTLKAFFCSSSSTNICPSLPFFEGFCLALEEARGLGADGQLLRKAAAETHKDEHHILLRGLCEPLEPLLAFSSWAACCKSPTVASSSLSAIETPEAFEKQLLILQDEICIAREAGVPADILRAAERLCNQMEVLLIDAKRLQEEAKLLASPGEREG
ncbi:hypothetical protein Esti_000473 [Eimeria stiedai]